MLFDDPGGNKNLEYAVGGAQEVMLISLKQNRGIDQSAYLYVRNCLVIEP